MGSLPLLRSSLLAVPHGFSLREGGVSSEPYGTLNLSTATGDAPERVAENLRRLAEAAGVDPRMLRTVSQVHGDVIVRAANIQEGAGVGGGGRATHVPPSKVEADGVWTDEPTVAVAVRTADCVPVLMADETGRRVMAVHSGWRGTELRIVARAVEVLVAQGALAGALTVAIGPSIRACCYEVSEELADRFRKGFGEGVVLPPPVGRWARGSGPHLDLATAVRATLVAAGVRPERVDLLPHCTACDGANFFSHRRDGARTGRHMGFVVAV